MELPLHHFLLLVLNCAAAVHAMLHYDWFFTAPIWGAALPLESMLSGCAELKRLLDARCRVKAIKRGRAGNGKKAFAEKQVLPSQLDSAKIIANSCAKSMAYAGFGFGCPESIGCT